MKPDPILSLRARNRTYRQISAAVGLPLSKVGLICRNAGLGYGAGCFSSSHHRKVVDDAEDICAVYGCSKPTLAKALLRAGRKPVGGRKCVQRA